eukprot:2223072-Amphidinium_carterae.1
MQSSHNSDKEAESAEQQGLLEGFHQWDPQDPQNARMLQLGAGKQEDVKDREPAQEMSCAVEPLQVDALLSRRRLQKIMERTEHEALEDDVPIIPAFEWEVDAGENLAGGVDQGGMPSPRGALLSETEAQRDFVRRVRARVRKVAAVKTHLSYNSIVREYMAEGEEMDLYAVFRRLQQLLLPKRTLRPHVSRPRPETSARFVRIHVSLSKVYNAPVRNVGDSGSSVSQSWNPAGRGHMPQGGYNAGGSAHSAHWQGGHMPFGHGGSMPSWHHGSGRFGAAPVVLGQSAMSGVA